MKTALIAALTALALLAPVAGHSQVGDDLIVEAREALRVKDAVKLATLRDATQRIRHPLAQWVDYFEIGNRLATAQHDELEAFYARWPGTYVEDRLRNDWLLELGKRRDWANFARDYPRFRMNDDREVTCYALITQHLDGQDVRDAARQAWLAQRDAGDACGLMATTLYSVRRLTPDDVWQATRVAAEFNRPRVARAAAQLIGEREARAVAEAFERPMRQLEGRTGSPDLALLSLMRLAAADPAAAAAQLDSTWEKRLPATQAALAWAIVGKQAGLRLQPEALDHYRRAWSLVRPGAEPGWSDDTLAWAARVALRAPAANADRWPLVLRSIDAMSAAEQRDAAWVYWRARSLLATAAPGEAGDAQRAAARVRLEGIAGQMSFYGKLATEDLGGSVALPPPPQPLSAAEREAARSHPGMARALQLIALGLRSEGVREWNFSLRGLADRELLAAAAMACEREVWDRCINTSDRTRDEIDMAQRFPMPFRRDVLAQARALGLDPAYMYGLIRQESRFVMDARSHVGASGLMQIMPATARWTAKKIGMDFRNEMITDRDVNLRLGASYLKLVLDDFGGSQALAAAAYNAGPNRPRRWREGGVLEPAIWAESIPFSETRDYVKKVLSNAVYYAALISGQAPPSLRARLGGTIGPREASAPATDREIP